MAKPKTQKKADDAAAETSMSPTGSQADYEAFLPLAREVPEGEIVPLRADLQLALHNAQLGVDAVLAEKKRLAALPETRVDDIASLPKLMLAAIFANTQIDRSAPASDVQRLLARASVLRKLLLSTAEALAAAGLLPAARVEKIRAGTGKLDIARDCVELSALFAGKGKELRGKHAVSAAQVTEAAEVGTALLKVLKPGRAKRGSAMAPAAAIDRDRLWTLALRRYESVWRAGAYLFGPTNLDEKIPSLQASRGGRPKKAAAPKAPPVEP